MIAWWSLISALFDFRIPSSFVAAPSGLGALGVEGILRFTQSLSFAVDESAIGSFFKLAAQRRPNVFGKFLRWHALADRRELGFFLRNRSLLPAILEQSEERALLFERHHLHVF